MSSYGELICRLCKLRDELNTTAAGRRALEEVRQGLRDHAYERDNPHYPPDHVFTVTKCQKCGEYFEACLPHVCRKKNSWPFDDYEEGGES